MKNGQDSSLDRALAAWATHDAGDNAAIDRIIQHADTVAQPEVRTNRWWMAGAFAATAALVFTLMPMARDLPDTPGQTTGTVELAELDLDQEAAFDLLYAPTNEEYEL